MAAPWDGRLVTYLGIGLLADRPVSPNIAPGMVAIYFATDEDAAYFWDSVTEFVPEDLELDPSLPWIEYARAKNAEELQDFVGAMLSNSASINLIYDDGAGTFSATVNDSWIGEKIQDIVGASLVEGANIAINYDDSTGEIEIAVTGSLGATVLADLTDVDVTTTPPDDGQALIWDAGSSKWIPGDVAAGGGGGGGAGSANVGAHRYWMMTDFSVADGSPYPGFAEIQVKPSPGGIPYTIAAVSAADSAYGAVANANNGTTTEEPGWASNSSQWFKFDLGTPEIVGQIELWARNNGGFYNRTVSGFQLWYSDDDEVYQSVCYIQGMTYSGAADSDVANIPLTIPNGNVYIPGLYDMSKGVPELATINTYGTGGQFTFSETPRQGLNIMYTGSDNGQPNIGGFLVDRPVGDFHVAVLCLANQGPSQYYGKLFGIYETATDKSRVSSYFNNGHWTSGLMSYSGPSTRTANAETGQTYGGWAGPMWMHIKLDSGTVYFGTSMDGKNPAWVWSESVTTYVTAGFDKLLFGGFFEDSGHINNSFTFLCYDDDVDSRKMGTGGMAPVGVGGLPMVALSQAAYDALTPPDPNTYYFIV